MLAVDKVLSGAAVSPLWNNLDGWSTVMIPNPGKNWGQPTPKYGGSLAGVKDTEHLDLNAQAATAFPPALLSDVISLAGGECPRAGPITHGC